MSTYPPVLETLKKAEAQLEEMLGNSRPMITIGTKDNQAHLSDALESTQSAIRSLLKVELTLA